GKASDPSGCPVRGSRKAKDAENDRPKKNAVSSAEPSTVEDSGARHYVYRPSLLMTVTSSNCPTRNAVPEASAMRGVESHAEMTTAMAKPASTTLRAAAGPNRRLVRSLTRKATG